MHKTITDRKVAPVLNLKLFVWLKAQPLPEETLVSKCFEVIVQGWANYGPGTICNPLHFPIRPAKLERILLIVSE